MRKIKSLGIATALMLLAIALSACTLLPNAKGGDPQLREETLTVADIPEYSGSWSCVINNNIPNFTEAELALPVGTEIYGRLDGLGRVTGAIAVVGPETMPTESRGDISEIKPTGWHQVHYDVMDSDYLDTRAHVIAFCLTAENANERNLITGTHCMNSKGMLEYEEKVAAYIDKTKNHVIYYSAPVWEGKDLLAHGVHMMAYSLEDQGKGISFNIYVYNVEPKITLDYATGNSTPSPDGSTQGYLGDKSNAAPEVKTYVLNTNSKKFHLPTCSALESTKEKNKRTVEASRTDLLSQGYSSCGNCGS